MTVSKLLDLSESWISLSMQQGEFNRVIESIKLDHVFRAVSMILVI